MYWESYSALPALGLESLHFKSKSGLMHIIALVTILWNSPNFIYLSSIKAYDIVYIQGTAERLTMHLVEEHSVVDPTYIEDFLLTYRTFLSSPMEVGKKLLEWFNDPSLRDKVKIENIHSIFCKNIAWAGDLEVNIFILCIAW